MAKKKKTQRPPQKPAAGRPSKKGGAGTIIIAAVITVIAGIAILAYFAKERAWLAKAPAPPAAEKNLAEVSVFFSDEEGFSLKAEKRRIKKGSTEAQAMETLKALVQGPENPKLGRTLPDGTRLLGLTLKDGTAAADFSAELVRNHTGGSSGEIQTVYSIVNSLALNFPEIKEVRITVDGKKQATIAGHIDISYPLTPDKKAVKD